MSAVAPPTRSVLARGASGRVEIRCAGCGYGGVVARLPERCPMCGRAAWRELTRRDRADSTSRDGVR